MSRVAQETISPDIRVFSFMMKPGEKLTIKVRPFRRGRKRGETKHRSQNTRFDLRDIRQNAQGMEYGTVQNHGNQRLVG